MTNLNLSQLLQFIISGLTSGSIYALIALGFTLIFNATNIINFAQGELVMLGGVTAVSLNLFLRPAMTGFFANVLSLPAWLSSLGATLIILILSVLAVTLIGMIFERLVIHPLRNASVISLIISTIGVSIFLKGLAMMLWGKDPLSLPSFSGDTPIKFFGASITPQNLWVFGLTFLSFGVLQFFFSYTITGKAIKACSVNKTAASLVGINTSRMVLYSFALSAGLGAMAGVIITPIAMTSFSAGSVLGLKGFVAAVLGGLGAPLGAVVGVLLLGVLESLSIAFISSGYKDAIAFFILLKSGTRRSISSNPSSYARA